MDVYPSEILAYINLFDDLLKESNFNLIRKNQKDTIPYKSYYSYLRLANQVSALIDIALGRNNFYSNSIKDILYYSEDNSDEVTFILPTRDNINDIKKLINQATQKYRILLKSKKEIFYVDPSRIEELKSINHVNFDLRRLILLCEYINFSYSNNVFISIPLLIRTILNHIPPVFGSDYKKFSEVINNYSGDKSFKEQMNILNGSIRKLADNYLHSTIDKNVLLPNKTQIDQKANLDVLLAEVVKVLK